VARTVHPERHAERRLRIIDAALTCFATEGYAGATTAAICRRAGIGSGTFFHYFPTKSEVLLAILDLGTAETTEWFAEQAGRDDARAVLLDWVRHTADELTDPRVAGFVRAVGAVMTDPAIATAFAADEDAQAVGLRHWVRRAQEDREVRTDLTTDSLTSWLMLVVDGYVGRLAGDDGFVAEDQRDTLVEAVERLLAP
jgi:AcrR family transcriptional regulator